MVTALATMLRSVRLELAEGQVIRQVARLTVRPRSLRMTVRPRNRPRAGAGL
jgi:pentalenene oxygenase